jgi:phosphatidylinositol alpha-mannosyltransferase
MKIGFVLDDSLDKPDGVQQYVLTLGTWLEGQGHTVHYLVGETKRTDIANLHSLSHNSSVRFNHNRLAIPWPAKRGPIRQLLKKEKFDILHVQMPYSPFLAGRIIEAASGSTAIIGTFHIVPFARMESVGTKLLKYAVSRSLRQIDRVISVSTAAQTFAKQSMALSSTVIPNPVDVQILALGAPLAQFTPDKKTILFLGRLVERKGCKYLLEAAALLKKQNKLQDVRIVICGKGPLDGKLQRFVKQNKMEDIVEFTGFVEEGEKANYLASADIAIFPSTGGESFGIVLIEAMAAGAGIVMGGDNPGYRSVLGDHPELLFDPANTQLFAKKLEAMLANEALRKSLHAWQQMFVDRYDVQNVGTQLSELYTETLQQKQSVR